MGWGNAHFKYKLDVTGSDNRYSYIVSNFNGNDSEDWPLGIISLYFWGEGPRWQVRTKIKKDTLTLDLFDFGKGVIFFFVEEVISFFQSNIFGHEHVLDFIKCAQFSY